MGGKRVGFGRFLLDPEQRELSREGVRVQLGSRTMDILCELASAKGDVVSKDQLLERVWPGLSVEDGNIHVHISALRKALDEGAGGKSFVVTVPGRGYRLIGLHAVSGDNGREPGKLDAEPPPMNQEIKYCRTSEGVRLAYATAGSGPPLVKTANWLNHLEYDWETPVWQHVVQGLAQKHTLLRYDTRGTGMSDWDVETLSLDAWVSDLETVVDAAGVDRFPSLGSIPGLCGVHCLCCSTPRTNFPSHSLWRICPWDGEEITGGQGTSSGNDDVDASWLGIGQSGLSTHVHRAIHAGGHAGAGCLLQ